MISIVLYCMASYGTTWNCFVSYRIAQFSVQYGIEWYCIIHSGIAWYCIVGFGVRLVSPKTPIYFKIFMQTNFSEKSYSKDQDPLAYIDYILHLVFFSVEKVAPVRKYAGQLHYYYEAGHQLAGILLIALQEYPEVSETHLHNIFVWSRIKTFVNVMEIVFKFQMG